MNENTEGHNYSRIKALSWLRLYKSLGVVVQRAWPNLANSEYSQREIVQKKSRNKKFLN